MSRIDDFSQLISGIYSAALAPEQWDDAVAAIARAFDAHTASLVFSANGSHTLAHAQMPPAAAQTYTEHYGRLDHVLCAVDAGPLGAVRTGAELMWPYQNCEFQVDWARPNGLHDGLFVRLTSGSPVASLAVANVKRPERFDSPEHVEMAHLLIPTCSRRCGYKADSTISITEAMTSPRPVRASATASSSSNGAGRSTPMPPPTGCCAQLMGCGSRTAASGPTRRLPTPSCSAVSPGRPNWPTATPGADHFCVRGAPVGVPTSCMSCRSTRIALRRR